MRLPSNFSIAPILASSLRNFRRSVCVLRRSVKSRNLIWKAINARTTKHLWESCTKSELRRLHDTEPNLTKILQDKDKDNKEFQLLVKEMEKRPRDEEYQSKSRNAGNRSAR